MIISINIDERKVAEKILQIQKLAYAVEAEIINYYKIPPLLETLNDLIHCKEIFIAYQNNEEILGFLSYTIQGQKIEICRLAIHPDYFKNGIATALLQFLCSIKNITEYKVSTGAVNLPAICLYLKFGFEETHKSIIDDLVLVHFVKKN
jgi:ribosomal protein S18 acetylase RimI-like enzyme